jgi:predicted nucleic acid-binding protein
VSATIADAGVLVALLVRSDQHHRWASDEARNIAWPLQTCEAALAEAAHLLRRGGADETVLAEWLERGLIRIPFHLETEAAAVKTLLRTYRNVPMSLADACLVRMAELDGQAKVWTTDSHFSIYRRHGQQIIALVAPFSPRSPK